MMPAIAEADVGLLVDVDVPWIPKHTKENPQTWWAHIDVDVVKECFPIWRFASNARVQGDSVLILRQLLEALKAKATPAFRDAAAKRMEAIKRESDERRAALSKQAADKVPILTVLFDNSGWSAVKEATLRVYPEGDAKATNEFNALLAPDIEFTKICEAAGGYGERVDDPEAVPAAIQRCLKEVRGGRSALAHVRIPVL